MAETTEERFHQDLVTEKAVPVGVLQIRSTNLAFKDWNTIFPNASCAVALVDRLTHHAEIIRIEGESYRRRDAELTQKKRRNPA